MCLSQAISLCTQDDERQTYKHTGIWSCWYFTRSKEFIIFHIFRLNHAPLNNSTSAMHVIPGKESVRGTLGDPKQGHHLLLRGRHSMLYVNSDAYYHQLLPVWSMIVTPIVLQRLRRWMPMMSVWICPLWLIVYLEYQVSIFILEPGMGIFHALLIMFSITDTCIFDCKKYISGHLCHIHIWQVSV